ncbi:MAG: T6SS immunity protein Tdi1 domain-containing protein [Pseudomonadota bacterium]
MASVDLGEVRSALSEWSWLLREDAWNPVLVSASGDVFHARASGEIFRLDTGSGKLARIADTAAEFEASLEDVELAEDLLLTPVVDELLNSGRALVPGQCFSFAILPIFKEGSYAAANRFPLSAVEHVRVTGDIHAQIQGMEDGQQVRLSVVE